MPTESTYSLYDLHEHLRRAIALNFSEAVWVQAEISGYNESRGHHYLSLLEKGEGEREILAQADAIIWERQFRKLRKKLGKELEQLLAIGRQIQLKARLDFHERYGLKLIVEDLDLAYTLGQLELQRRAILEQLQAEQILHKNKQHSLPPVLQHLAIISATQAAGWKDFQEQLADNQYGYQFDCQLFTAAMQGVNTRTEILQQLKRIRRQLKNYDAVFILRGGGARLDLSTFDDYELGKAIAEFPLPVITGIGHEIDENIVDAVAHTSLRTPTAAADFLIQHNTLFEQNILQLVAQFKTTIQSKLRREQTRLNTVHQQAKWNTQQRIQASKWRLQQLSETLPALARHQITQQRDQLTRLAQLHELLGLEQTLKRGFVVASQSGEILKNSEQIAENQPIQLQFSDQKVDVKVNK
ncbi:MAG: exodeoxyribonuclease VII large subunit [Bacteroidota bacterium]